VHRSPAPTVAGDETSRRAFATAYPTALGYRPDWGLFTNNGASCPVDFAAHGVAELALRAPPLSADGSLSATTLLRGALDILLRGGGWYGAGVEERFVAAHPSVLWACAAYLARTRDRDFLARHRGRMRARMLALFALDHDGDGIAESGYPGRGEAPGGSAWFDQLRAGHQDAFSTPIAYRALDLLVGMWRWAGDEAAAEECAERARRLRAAFLPTFRAPSGRIAGWRDARGELHDHGFIRRPRSRWPTAWSRATRRAR